MRSHFTGFWLPIGGRFLMTDIDGFVVALPALPSITTAGAALPLPLPLPLPLSAMVGGVTGGVTGGGVTGGGVTGGGVTAAVA